MSNRGFSLLELMVVVAIFAGIAIGVLGFLYQGQTSFQAQSSLNESTEQARIAMDQIVRYLRHSGNDPFSYMESNLIPAVQILGDNHVRINSDVTGAVPSITGNNLEATGDPDGNLDSIHEQVTFRYDPGSRRLFVDIGYGERVLADRISDFNLSFYDGMGTPTTDSDSVARVGIRMVAETREISLESGHRNEVALHSDVFLRAKAFNPFEQEGPDTTVETGSGEVDSTSP